MVMTSPRRVEVYAIEDIPFEVYTIVPIPAGVGVLLAADALFPGFWSEWSEFETYTVLGTEWKVARGGKKRVRTEWGAVRRLASLAVLFCAVVNACMLRLLLPLLSLAHSLLLSSEAVLQSAAEYCGRGARCADQVEIANYWRLQYAALRARSTGKAEETSEEPDRDAELDALRAQRARIAVSARDDPSLSMRERLGLK